MLERRAPNNPNDPCSQFLENLIMGSIYSWFLTCWKQETKTPRNHEASKPRSQETRQPQQTRYQQREKARNQEIKIRRSQKTKKAWHLLFPFKRLPRPLNKPTPSPAPDTLPMSNKLVACKISGLFMSGVKYRAKFLHLSFAMVCDRVSYVLLHLLII